MFWMIPLCIGLAQLPDYIEIFVQDGPQREVFLTAAEAEAVRARRDTDPDAAATIAKLLADADALAAAPLEIPHDGGQWKDWYTCEKDGAPLKARTPHEHVCTKCGQVYTGERFDQVYVAYRHRYWTLGVENLGWAYSVDPKPAYAERARAILLEYASFYPDLKLHDRDGGNQRSAARLHAQTLDEAIALCQLCVGYDRVYDAPCFSAEDHQAIADRLFRPMIAVIQPNEFGSSNWQAWHNAAVGCAGFVLRDDNLVEWAVNGPSGFVNQMNNAVLGTGSWYEESPTYHWVALRGLVYLMEAAARSGVDLYAHPNVKKMFDAPVRLLFPDLTFPAINDSDRSSISEARALYEVAFRRYGDPQYAALLAPRNTTWGLFWGGAPLPEGDIPEFRPGTSNAQAEGLAILRDASNETALYLDYGGKKSDHVQLAKLGIILFAQGDERFVDPGRLAYGNPLHTGWFRETIAHNAVVVGKRSQSPAAARLLAFLDTDDFDLVRAQCDEAYESTLLDRTLVMTGNLALDIVQCHAAQQTAIDLPYHLRGTLAGLPEAASCDPLGTEGGYKLLEDAKRFAEPVASFLIEADGGRTLRVSFPDSQGEFYLAQGLGPGARERLPMLLRRQQVRDAVFVAAYEWFTGDPPPARTVSIESKAGVIVKVDDWSLELIGDTVLRRNGQRAYLGPDGVTGSRPE